MTDETEETEDFRIASASSVSLVSLVSFFYTPIPMSLYGLYRPKSFADVVGQDHIVGTLEQAVKQDKLSHAYLFAGQRGTGKTSVARILAKILLTRAVEDETLARQIVRGVDDGSLVDCVEIDAATNTQVDHMRDLIEKIQFSPVVASAKVYIIDEAHMLSKGAFNALLKTLEEPPPYAFFILATTELFKIPPTIQSRCQRFLFQHIREEEIIRRLQFIADQERITVERQALRAIAHAVQGSMRDAIALLDQLRTLPAITADEVRLRVGESGHEYVEEAMVAVAAGDRAALLQIVERMEQSAVPMETFLRLLLASVREELHAGVGRKEDPAPHLRRLDAILHAVRDARSSPLPSLVVESALLALCDTEVATPVAKAERERKTQKAPESAPPAPAASAQQTSPPAPSPIVEAPDLTLETIRNAWPGVLQLTTPPAVRMSLKNARIAGVEGNTLTLHFTSAFHRDKVKATEAARGIEAVLETIFKRPVRIACLLESEAATPATQSDVVNLADAAAEIF
ncbi:MAG: DNA polymerase III subunit gamma/tau [Candidatus Peregrinibacteria bacterium Gr01-1014_25]|nr:MAG: DNA polymerase III subunit gamma/tau [Candidatus Peregrinibacteria bacterium Gr01-1014_25]